MALQKINTKDVLIVQNEKLKEDFLKTLEDIFKKNPNVAIYLKTLDGKSSESYSHSVNVAFHVFERLSNDKMFSYTKDEIERWTEAALVHDTGKLTTKNEILHSHADMRGEKRDQTEKDADFAKMMRHSLDGYYLGVREFKFEKESIAAIIGHHVNAPYLESNSENKFAEAYKSRDEWELEFEKGYIENLLQENLGWMTKKDIHALETISFCDDIEALRSTDRTYQLQHYWDKDDFTPQDEFGRKHGVNVENCIQENINKKHRLSKDFDGVILDKSFQKHFDSMQEMQVPVEVREMVSEYAKDVKVRVFRDKAKDIERNPELGKMFFEKRTNENGQTFLVFASKYIEKPVVLPFKEDLEKDDLNFEDILDIDDNLYRGLIREEEEYDEFSLDEEPYEVGDLE